MCAEMFETSKQLAKIGMPEGLSDLEQQAYVFERIYGETPENLIRTDKPTKVGPNRWMNTSSRQ